ncbi:unnamed protein product [Gongylonema pulchrum]|uniref:Myosin motor domain-containing protein n=1 Tax=Gongylonema pulchrum TaxID=637853 RepID=A0A183E694_9BILA|nr:unnamed protein product [Gongylonema pulchrum]
MRRHQQHLVAKKMLWLGQAYRIRLSCAAKHVRDTNLIKSAIFKPFECPRLDLFLRRYRSEVIILIFYLPVKLVCCHQITLATANSQ